MKSLYRISREAYIDLENIWEYTLETWSEEQANRYYSVLIEEIEYITSHFDEGKDMGHIKEGYKCAKVKSHIIFYKKGTDNITQIIRILHQMMDIENKLK